MLDVSASMAGEPIEAIGTGLQMVLSELRSDPQALETACLSIITFASAAQQVIPLTDLASFQVPTLKVGGATSLGEALILLASKIDLEVIKSTPETKGDWKPLVFLFTDGEPTDDVSYGIQEIAKRQVMLVACGAGHGANENVLRQITSNVLSLKAVSSGDIKAYFGWISSSIGEKNSQISA